VPGRRANAAPLFQEFAMTEAMRQRLPNRPGRQTFSPRCEGFHWGTPDDPIPTKEIAALAAKYEAVNHGSAS
jgi:hypothetical protein